MCVKERAENNNVVITRGQREREREREKEKERERDTERERERERERDHLKSFVTVCQVVK